MTRKWYAGIAVFLVTMAVAMVASAEPLRVAKGEDDIGSLAGGLRRIDGAIPGSCAAGGLIASYVNEILPGRPADEGDPSFEALTIGDRIVAVVADDVHDLSTPIAVNTDMGGNGLITNVWPIQNVPAPCAVIRGPRMR